MTSIKTTTRATRTSTPSTLARTAVATLLVLAAPAVSFLPALTTDIHGSGAAVAGRSGLVAISLGLGAWLVIGLAVTIAGASLGHHTHLTEWGIALMAAVLAGAAVGLPLAARR